MGFPRTKWEVRSGHDRFGDWETVQEDSWDDFGIRYDGTVAWRPGNEGALFFTGFYEEYDAEFDGSDAEFTGFGGFLGVRFSW